MGIDLKGKELGVGISQRSDGFYAGRFTTKYGQRKQKCMYCAIHLLPDVIEDGMKSKTLQVILGHSNIGITMDLYVHTTEDEKNKETEKIAASLKLV